MCVVINTHVKATSTQIGTDLVLGSNQRLVFWRGSHKAKVRLDLNWLSLSGSTQGCWGGGEARCQRKRRKSCRSDIKEHRNCIQQPDIAARRRFRERQQGLQNKSPNRFFLFLFQEKQNRQKKEEEKKTNYIKATLYLAQHVNLVVMFATVQCVSFWPRRRGAERSGAACRSCRSGAACAQEVHSSSVM